MQISILHRRNIRAVEVEQLLDLNVFRLPGRLVEPKSVEGQRLLKRYQKIRDHLLLFLTDETIPPPNNSSEQALRWSVVFHKVTNGFRSDWGAELFAQVRSLVNTAKRHGISAFDAISRALTP